MRPDDKRRFNGRPPKWDTETGRQMYDAGVSTAAIAKALGVTYQAVYKYSARHWSPAALAGYSKEDRYA